MSHSPDGSELGPSATSTAARAAGASPGRGLAKLVAPIASLAAVWGVRKALDRVYRAGTGSAPPRASDPDVPLRRVVAWAAISAAALAAVTVVIDRATARWER
jgi:hypothetical protein